jgi:D-aminopeptidase
MLKLFGRSFRRAYDGNSFDDCLQTRGRPHGRCIILFALLAIALFTSHPGRAQEARRPRAREVGVVVGIFPTGQYNAITDVAGVRVGHATVIEGDNIRTGVTAIIPRPGNLYAEPVPAWIHVRNGYGKLLGETQVREFGEIETPILPPARSVCGRSARRW